MADRSRFERIIDDPEEATKADKKPSKAAKPEVLTVIVQRWMERDSWSGPSSDGYSLHLTKEHHAAYMKAFSERRRDEYTKSGGRVPECYDSPEGDAYVGKVDEETHKQVKAAGRKGIRRYDTKYPKKVG